MKIPSLPTAPMRPSRRALLALTLLAPLVPWSTPSVAQTWPQRPVKFLLPLGPGSGVDIGARLLADRLTARWGQPVVVENRPGGDAILAISTFVNAKDDHVLLGSPTSSFTAHPFLHENLPYKPSDLQPIARVSNTLITLAVPAALNVGSIAELIAMARAQPGKLNWAGVTGALDFLFAGFLKNAGLTMTKVPYRNPVEAANDLGENRVQAYISALAIARPTIEAGKVKPLAVTNSVRAPTLPGRANRQGSRPSRADARRAGGLFRTAGNARRAARAHCRRHSRRRRRSDDRGAARRHRTNPQSRRARRVRRATDEQRAKIAAIAKELGIKPTQ